MNTFDLISRIAEGVLAVFSAMVVFVKPFRLWILGIKDRRRIEELRDANRDEGARCSIRTIFVEFYFSHNITREIHQYEYENLALAYAVYKKLGGNSFVDKIWAEIQTWTIIP